MASMQTPRDIAKPAATTTADSAESASGAVVHSSANNRAARRAAKFGLNAKGKRQRQLLQSMRLSGKGSGRHVSKRSVG